MDIAVVIPTHPGRKASLLDRAIKSVLAQTWRPDELIITVDNHARGAGATRNRGLMHSQSTFTAFLDSDDEFLPNHLEVLTAVMRPDPRIIMAFTWFEAVGMPDPLGHFGLPFNPATPHHTTVTTMVQTQVAQEVGGFPANEEGSTPACLNDDWIFLLRMCQYAVANDKKIVHIPQRTWRYHSHGRNTSGRPTQGDGREKERA